MNDLEKLGLFMAIIGLTVLAAKGSASLAKETGIPALMISGIAGFLGHGLA